jgi:hypothetical protein
MVDRGHHHDSEQDRSQESAAKKHQPLDHQCKSRLPQQIGS